VTHIGGTYSYNAPFRKIVAMHLLDLNIQTFFRIYFFSSCSTTFRLQKVLSKILTNVVRLRQQLVYTVTTNSLLLKIYILWVLAQTQKCLAYSHFTVSWEKSWSYAQLRFE